MICSLPLNVRTHVRCDPRSILIISIGGLGDFLSRWPLWQSARKMFPHAALSYLGYPSHGAMLIATGLCDGMIDFDQLNPKSKIPNPNDGEKRNVSAWGGGPACAEASAGRRAHLASESIAGGRDGVGEGIQNPEYELIVSVMGKLGREWVKQSKFHEAATTVVEIDPFQEEGAGVSVRGYVMAQALSMGFVDPGPPQIGIPACARTLADGIWRTHGLNGKRVIVIHPGSGARSKNWPIDRFVDLAARFTMDGAVVIVLEGEVEESRRDSWEDPGWGRGVVHISGLDLIGVAALLARCERYVGNDSGISHLAALAGVPTTVIFGPTDPALWAPSGTGKVTVLRKAIPCAPCAKARRDLCPDGKCLTGIGVEEVMEASVLA